MKSNRGVTLTSLIIYIIAFTIIVGIMSVVSTNMYSNIKEVSTASDLSEYTKFNSYFTEQVNTKDLQILDCNTIKDGETVQESYISFSNNNKYTYKNNAIYFNKIKICRNVQSCEFQKTEENGKVKITVKMMLNGENFENIYTMKTW